MNRGQTLRTLAVSLSFGAIPFLALALVACAPAGQAIDSGTMAQADVQNGVQVYQRWCASCHGGDGLGGSAVSMFVVDSMSDGELMDVILNGTDGMPSTPLSDADLIDLIAWLRQSF
ncbi:MAG: cytochrome c [Alphaproteobacteria bacterium]|nr:cytochrome c [Alphaproteobacteria bacterium]